METEINLLPWRDGWRQQQHRRFLTLLAMAMLLGIGGGWCLANWQQTQLETQDQRNHYIQNQIQRFDHDIQAMKKAKASAGKVLAQIERIRGWQHSRAQTIRIFNHLVTSLESGVYYLRLAREDRLVRITGMAETSRQVTDQLNALTSGGVFSTPVLSEVQAQGQWRRFDMSVRALMAPEIGLDDGERVGGT